MDDNIFSIYKPKKNTSFSSLSKDEIDKLFKLLEKYYIDYRKKLLFNRRYSFGFEFETSCEEYTNISRELFKNGFYQIYEVKEENTVPNGCEVTTPLLSNTRVSWKNVSKVLDIIREQSNLTSECGSHIHIGSHILSYDPLYWENFFMLWSTYENIIYRFLYGEYINGRKAINKYAMPTRDLYQKVLTEHKLSTIREEVFLNFLKITTNRYYGVNLNCVHNVFDKVKGDTIEFRAANGTLNPIIWQNNLNMLVHLLLSVFNIDRNLINKRFIELTSDDLTNYSKINIDMVLEFCDLIFTNNLDKINFLRQYFKDFSEDNTTNLILSKKFTTR